VARADREEESENQEEDNEMMLPEMDMLPGMDNEAEGSEE